jgi:hypothetical protein
VIFFDITKYPSSFLYVCSAMGRMLLFYALLFKKLENQPLTNDKIL